MEFTNLIREIPNEIIEKHKNEWKDKEFNNKRLNEINGFLKKLEKTHKDKTVLLIAHAKLNRAIMSILTGIGLYEIYSFKQNHACINILKREKVVGEIRNEVLWRIVLLNSVEHLPRKIRTSMNKKTK